VTQVESGLALPARFAVLVARHATPDRSRFDIPYYRPPGPALTERGRAEAAALGEFMRSEGLVHLLSSPFERTWTTGQIAGKIARVPIELNTDLMEWQPGERDDALQKRMGQAFSLAARFSFDRGLVGLISHGAPVLALLKLLGLPGDLAERSRIYDGRNLLPPAGAWLVQREDSQTRLCLAYVPEGVFMPSRVEIACC